MPVTEFKHFPRLALPLNKVRSGMNFGTIDDNLPHKLYVAGGHNIRVCEHLGDVDGDTDLVNLEIWIRRDDCPAGEINSLS